MKTLSYSFVCKIQPQSSITSPYSKKNQMRKLPLRSTSSFFFFFSIRHNPKVYGVYEQSAHQMTALLSEIFLFIARAACKLISTTQALNRHSSGFPIRQFVRNYRHKSKTESRIRTFYLSNNCSTIQDADSLGQGCMWDMIGEL